MGTLGQTIQIRCDMASEAGFPRAQVPTQEQDSK